MEATQQRRRQYERLEREKLPKHQITDRDVAIVAHVAEHRFLRSSHIRAHLPEWSDQQTLRRLRMLYDAGYLDRPREQIKYRHRAGSDPMVYALGNRGASLLTQYHGIDRGRIDWAAKNREVQSRYLEHTLLVADVMATLERMCREREDMRLIAEQEILERFLPETTKQLSRPFSWKVEVKREGRRHALSVVPDKVFGLEYEAEPDRPKWFFLEADRGTMTIEPQAGNLSKSSIYRKFIAYYETHRQGLHRQRFEFNNFRVLTVTTVAKRAQSIVNAAQEVTSGASLGLFLTIDKHSFLEKGSL